MHEIETLEVLGKAVGEAQQQADCAEYYQHQQDTRYDSHSCIFLLFTCCHNISLKCNVP